MIDVIGARQVDDVTEQGGRVVRRYGAYPLHLPLPLYLRLYLRLRLLLAVASTLILHSFLFLSLHSRAFCTVPLYVRIYLETSKKELKTITT